PDSAGLRPNGDRAAAGDLNGLGVIDARLGVLDADLVGAGGEGVSGQRGGGLEPDPVDPDPRPAAADQTDADLTGRDGPGAQGASEGRLLARPEIGQRAGAALVPGEIEDDAVHRPGEGAVPGQRGPADLGAVDRDGGPGGLADEAHGGPLGLGRTV